MLFRWGFKLQQALERADLPTSPDPALPRYVTAREGLEEKDEAAVSCMMYSLCLDLTCWPSTGDGGGKTAKVCRSQLHQFTFEALRFLTGLVFSWDMDC